jgi:hypothetical protein
MANYRGFEHRLFGSDHFIKWSQDDIDFIAAHFGIPAKDIPSEQAVWNRQRNRARAQAAFIVEGPWLEPLKLPEPVSDG